jgi:hypothetical protein
LVSLGGLAALGLAALCIPVEAVLNYDSAASPRLRFRVVWLFGLAKREVARTAPRVRTRPFRLQTLPGLFPELTRLIRDVLARTRVREMSVDIRLGLGDPFATGMACAAAATITPLTTLLPARCRFSVQPSFAERVFHAHLQSNLRIRPVRLVVPLSRFALSKAGRRMMRGYFSRRQLRPASATGR